MTTAIEALVAQANAEEGSPGYHVTATFADGSVVDAPILRVGPNWMTVDEIQPGPFLVHLEQDTKLEINWAPGAAYAEGPRFSDVAPSSSAPRM
jgi:hypothetical protein